MTSFPMRDAATRAPALRQDLVLLMVLLASSPALAQGPTWSTLLGGSATDAAYGVAVDSNGLVTIAGYTSSANWPYGAPAATTDVFVARLDPKRVGPAQRVWCTTLPGNGSDMAFDLAMSPDGRTVSVVGLTTSSNLQCTANAYQTILKGPSDAFVLQLDGNTGAVTYLSYLGGAGYDWANAVERDASGRLVIGGVTYHQSFPVTSGVVQPLHGGAIDMFVTVFDPAGPAQNIASTFLGGSGNEGYPYNLSLPTNMSIGDVVIASNGDIVVVGRTASTNFPTTGGAFQPAFAGGPGADMFLTRLDSMLTTLLYSTYLGGSDDDGAMKVVENAAGDFCIAGFTWSPGTWLPPVSFPTTAGAPQRTLAGNNDGVLAVLRTAGQGQGLRYATLLGGTKADGFAALVVEDSGVITAVGWSDGGFVGTTGAWQPICSPRDSLIVRLDPQGLGATDLHYVSFFGGPGGAQEYALGVARCGHGLLTFAGTSDAALWTSSGALQPAPGGGIDAFVGSFDPLPTGTVRHGASTAGCRGPLWLQVNGNPAPGNATFQVLGNGAPPNAAGVHMLDWMPLPLPGVRILNARLLVMPQFSWPGVSDPCGAWRINLPLPTWWPPLPSAYIQSAWIEPPTCPLGPLSATHALGF